MSAKIFLHILKAYLMVYIITKLGDSSSSQTQVQIGGRSFSKKPNQNRIKCNSANKKNYISLLNILLPLNTASLTLMEELNFCDYRIPSMATRLKKYNLILNKFHNNISNIWSIPLKTKHLVDFWNQKHIQSFVKHLGRFILRK